MNQQQQMKAIQSEQRCKHQQARFWPLYFKKERTINSEYYIALLVHLKEEIAKKTTTNEEEKSTLSPRLCTVSLVDCSDSKTT